MTLHIITGAPCSGKSTYVREHAKAGEVRVDFDALAQAFGSATPHGSTGDVRSVTFVARKAAIRWLLDNDEAGKDAYIIHSSPSAEQMEAYKAAGAEFVALDTDLETCLARAEADNRPEGEADKIRAWFEGQKAAQGVRTKAADLAMVADGIVEGYAATFDREPDSYGDVIARGAFSRTLSEWREKMGRGLFIPLLYGHATNDPEYNIGRVLDFKEDERGLWVRAEFDADNETAQKVRRLVAQGRLYQFSFAYSVRDAKVVDIDGFEANELRDLDLYEVSLVQIPANQHAEVTGIKSGRRNSAKDADALREIAEHARAIDSAIAELLEEQPEAGDAAKDAQTVTADAADRDASKARALEYIKTIQ